jgi:hypothetical protein
MRTEKSVRSESEIRDRLADVNQRLEAATNEWTREHLRMRKSELEWMLEPAGEEKDEGKEKR